MKKILITGATGFIGKSLIGELLEDKEVEITAITRGLDKTKEALTNNIKYLQIDLMHKDSLNRIKGDIDIIVHLANSLLPGSIASESRNQFLINTTITSNLLDIANKTNAHKIIFSSSSLIYSGSNISPYTEEATMIPNETLGASKIASESILKANSKERKIDTISLRIFTAYGPQSKEVQFIPEAINKISSPDKAVFGNPEVMRDFIYIDDVIFAFKKAIYKELNYDFTALNIASGKSHSIKEVVGKLKELLGSNKEIIFSKQLQRDRDIDPDHFVDISLTKNYLDWKPVINIDEGLRRTVNYFNRGRVDL